MLDALFTCLAIAVTDGDTFRCRTADLAPGVTAEMPIRLRALAAPESDERGGTAATAALRAVLADGRVACVFVELDRYDRIVADCRTARGDVAARMIGTGRARHCPRYGRPDLARLPQNTSLPLPGYCRRR